MSQPSKSEIVRIGDPIKAALALLPKLTPEERAAKEAAREKARLEYLEAQRPLCAFCGTAKVAGEFYVSNPERLTCRGPACLEKENEAYTQGFLKSFGVPQRYLSARLTDFGKRFAAFNPESKRDGILIQGKGTGIGKTHLAAAMLRRYGLSGRWTTVPELLMKIRATFRDGAQDTEDGIADRYGSAEIVALDDLGAEKVTDWSLSVLCVIINRRLNDCRPTIVTTNLTLAEIEAFDARLASRLSSFERIKLDGKDRRVSP